MKVALVYTSTTKELTELLESEVRKNIPKEFEILTYKNPDILAMAREAGYVTKQAAAALYKLYVNAIEDGAEAILNICSSVGLVADSAQEFANLTGVPIVRIDAQMCCEAARKGSRVGVLATLQTTLEPTKTTILSQARQIGKQVFLVDGLIDGAFGLDQEQFKQKLLNRAMEIKDDVDVILLAQGSMAYCEKYLEDAIGKPVLSSPRFGAIELKKALIRKGLIK